MTKIMIEISDDDYESIKRGMRYKDTIADIMQQIENAEPVLSSSENPNKWIPVSERLPEKYTYTLWCASSGYVRSDYFNGEFWEDAKKYCYEVVAWMPLPESYVPDINIGKMSEIPTGSEGSDKE